MAEQKLTLKANDDLPALVMQLSDSNGIFAIPSGSTVQINFRGVSDPTYAATVSTDILDGPTGVISWDRSSAPNTIAGTYQLEVEVTMGGDVQTFPSDGYVNLTIIPDLG